MDLQIYFLRFCSQPPHKRNNVEENGTMISQERVSVQTQGFLSFLGKQEQQSNHHWCVYTSVNVNASNLDGHLDERHLEGLFVELRWSFVKFCKFCL